jgi:hypothetical protein
MASARRSSLLDRRSDRDFTPKRFGGNEAGEATGFHYEPACVQARPPLSTNVLTLTSNTECRKTGTFQDLTVSSDAHQVRSRSPSRPSRMDY